MAELTFTAEQRGLARNALGLPNKQRRSYRNRFYAASEGPTREAWEDMERQGAAMRVDDRLFVMTDAGAEAVLDHGEKLDPEEMGWDPKESVL